MSETMPERYRISPWVTAHGAIGAATMEPHPNGEWVPADLYAALKEENERLRAEIEWWDEMLPDPAVVDLERSVIALVVKRFRAALTPPAPKEGE